jgi:hypothetical protein
MRFAFPPYGPTVLPGILRDGLQYLFCFTKRIVIIGSASPNPFEWEIGGIPSLDLDNCSLFTANCHNPE